MRKWLFYISIFISGMALGSSFKAQIDTLGPLKIGEQFTIQLIYEGDSFPTWKFYNDGDTITKDLEVIGFSNIDTINDNQPVIVQQELKVTAWDSGYFVVPPFFATANGETKRTAPALLRYTTVQLDPQADIKPVKEQIETPFIFEEIAFWVYLGVGVLIIILIILYLLNKYVWKNQLNKEEPEAPTIPIMEQLWVRFNRLASSRIWEQRKEKEFQSELTGILKKFIAFKHHINAEELTTSQISHQLSALGIEKELQNDIKHILNFADMVKFAKQTGDVSQHEKALEILKSILITEEPESE